MNSLDKEIDKAEKDVLTITAYDKSLSNILRLKSKKFSIEEMKNIVLKELETIRINPIYDEQRQKLIELFLDSNKHLITNKIKLNTTLNSAMRELSKVYNPDDKLFKFN